MKKVIAIALILLSALALAACGAKGNVQDKTQTPPVNSAPSGGASEASGGESGAKSEGGRQIATLEGYWDRIDREWREAPEEGYVWTITIDDTAAIEMTGLLRVDYALKLSCSHVGPDMFGAYSGEMDMSYNANLDAVMELLTMTGGSADYKADGWFRNSKFLMRGKEFSQETEDEWTDIFGKVSATEADGGEGGEDAQQYVDELMSSMFDGAGGGERDFEKTSSPAAIWYGYDFRMTEGDMSGYLQVTNIAYGTTTGGGSVDASGTQLQGAARSHLDTIFGSFDYSDSYAETVDSPFPYTLKIYEGGQVVFTVYSATGSPVTVKFYGTIDKVRVEDTTLVKPK